MKDLIKTTLSEQIYGILKEDILNQVIKCGEKLTLKSLQERFNISSTPVREAMNRLSQEGLLDHITNVGARVIQFDEKDIAEIYDLCSLLDSAAVKHAMGGDRTKELEAGLRSSILLQEQALEAGSIEDFIHQSDEFHYIFYQYADNSRLYKTMLGINSQFRILSNIYQNYAVAKPVMLTEHKAIASAVLEVDQDKAVRLMELHFAKAKNFLLEKLLL